MMCISTAKTVAMNGIKKYRLAQNLSNKEPPESGFSYASGKKRLFGEHGLKGFDISVWITTNRPRFEHVVIKKRFVFEHKNAFSAD